MKTREAMLILDVGGAYSEEELKKVRELLCLSPRGCKLSEQYESTICD